MKKLLIATLFLPAFAFTACNNSDSETVTETDSTTIVETSMPVASYMDLNTGNTVEIKKMRTQDAW